MTAPKDFESGLILDRLKDVLFYDPETGTFKRLKSVNQAGSDVGWLNPKTGYIIITVFGHKYMAHRLAWFFTHGVWPVNRLDHENLNNSDNRISNLREASDQENKRNQRKRSDSALGIKGVRLHECGKYQCRVFDGEKFITRTFATLIEAKNEYERLSTELFGEFARVA